MTATTNPNRLVFEPGASYMPRGSITFSIPAGHTCPFAGRCLSKVDNSGSLQPGERYVCMAATEELASSTRETRWGNFNLLRNAGDGEKEMEKLILSSIPKNDVYVLHRSGDFFSLNYFNAWMSVAKKLSNSIFLVQTTSIPYWVKAKGGIPGNVKISANLDTTQSSTVKREGFAFHGVVFSLQDAEDYGLPVERRLDKLEAGENYVSLVRSVQVTGTEAGEGVDILRTGRCINRDTLEGSIAVADAQM